MGGEHDSSPPSLSEGKDIPAEDFTTQIIVRETRAAMSGKNSRGHQWQMWQIVATKPDGQSLDHLNLRSFTDMPKQQVITVHAKLFKSPTYGDSYTLELVDQKPAPTQDDVIERLQRVERQALALNERLKVLEAGMPQARPPQPPPDIQAPPAGVPSDPMAPGQAPSGPPPGADEIPF